MKKLFFFLLCSIASSAFAQNWNTIVANDTTFYTVQASGNDSLWNGYLRCIWVDSVKSFSGIDTCYFYPSLRLNANNAIDTSMHGDTWLGKVKSRNSGGNEYYYNKYGDTILIKTLAPLNATWILTTDNNGIEYYATVNSLSTSIIDGVLDSIKTISVQAYLGGLTAPSTYNQLHIQLSKNHGFYSVFELYGFPYYEQTTVSNSAPYFPYPILPFQHVRMNRSKTIVNYENIDLSWKYKPGNDWITYDTTNTSSLAMHLFHDSILSSHPVLSNSQQVNHTINAYIDELVGINHIDSFYHTSANRTDTFYNNTINTIRNHLPEYKKLLQPYFYQIPSYKNFIWYFVTDVCNRHIQFKDTMHFDTGLSGYQYTSNTWLEGYGLSHQTMYLFNGSVATYSENHLLFAKLDSCILGTKFPVEVLSINEVADFSNHVFVYPNPTKSIVNISIPSQIATTSCIYTLQGVKLMEETHSTSTFQLNVTQFPLGIYVLEVKSKKGTAYKKFIKE